MHWSPASTHEYSSRRQLQTEEDVTSPDETVAGYNRTTQIAEKLYAYRRVLQIYHRDHKKKKKKFIWLKINSNPWQFRTLWIEPGWQKTPRSTALATQTQTTKN